MRKPIFQRFMEKVDKNGPEVRPGIGPCWLWTAAKMPDGRGVFQVGGSVGTIKAARLSFMLHYGDPGPYFVCHSCDNPSCVNPEHLWLGTNKDNMDDRDRKGRCKSTGPLGEANGSARTIVEKVYEIRERRGEPQRRLAREYGISQPQIGKIQRREAWAWLPERETP